MYDLLVTNARLYPMTHGVETSDSTTLAVNDGHIAALGVTGPARTTLDAAGRVVLPGFIDCHTHALYAGDRFEEHLQKLAGVGYEDIARAGGGILSTVRAVREASEQDLVDATLPRLLALRAEGVTTVEIKSGYGLDVTDELKMLRAIGRLPDAIALDVQATCLGLHACPPDTDSDAFVNNIIAELLPAVAAENLARQVDGFVADIAFSNAQLRKFFVAAQALGFGLRVHAEQLSALGTSALAAEFGAASCDHLEYLSDNDAQAMNAAGTVAVLLPGAFYCLRETRKPPVETLRAHGVAMAVATDLNPGSSPVASLLTAMHLAVTLFGLSPAEALLGVTRNAARVLERDDIGTLRRGAQANFSLWDLPRPEFLLYQLGGLRPAAVYVRGTPQ